MMRYPPWSVPVRKGRESLPAACRQRLPVPSPFVLKTAWLVPRFRSAYPNMCRGLMAHTARWIFTIDSGASAVSATPVKVLLQRFTEPVRQIRPAADGTARLRFPAQPLDQIDDRAFLMLHAVKENGTERCGIAVHLPGLQAARIGASRIMFNGHGTISMLNQHEVEQLTAGPPVAVHERMDVLEHPVRHGYARRTRVPSCRPRSRRAPCARW